MNIMDLSHKHTFDLFLFVRQEDQTDTEEPTGHLAQREGNTGPVIYDYISLENVLFLRITFMYLCMYT